VGIVPIEFDSANPDDIAALAAEIQISVDALVDGGVNKIILLAHMQQINIEYQLAELLTGVDIIVAGGSNTILADGNDYLRAGDEAEDTYPMGFTGADGNPVAVVNTAGNYRYVGRLVVGFDENGVLIPATIDPMESGAFATDDQGLMNLNLTAEDANADVAAIAQGVADVVVALEGQIFGNTSVYLNGVRGSVRTEETNLGNLTADANLWTGQQADPTVAISLKNGGGIRNDIGEVVFPPGSTNPDDAMFLPPQPIPAAGKELGDISSNDISGAVSFNNGLVLVTVTATELVATLEEAIEPFAPGVTSGSFPQVGGLWFSFDPSAEPGSRVRSLL
ncbi:MAG: 5'-nucleotidase C-terminal domain-containing protein, partial [Myxococcota bacterium]